MFVYGSRPLTRGRVVSVRSLQPCPCLICRRKGGGSFCFSRRFVDVLSFPGDVRIESETALFGLIVKLGKFAMDDNIVSRGLGKDDVVTGPLSISGAVEVNVVGGGGVVFDHCTSCCMRTLEERLWGVGDESFIVVGSLLLLLLTRRFFYDSCRVLDVFRAYDLVEKVRYRLQGSSIGNVRHGLDIKGVSGNETANRVETIYRYLGQGVYPLA